MRQRYQRSRAGTPRARGWEYSGAVCRASVNRRPDRFVRTFLGTCPRGRHVLMPPRRRTWGQRRERHWLGARLVGQRSPVRRTSNRGLSATRRPCRHGYTAVRLFVKGLGGMRYKAHCPIGILRSRLAFDTCEHGRVDTDRLLT
jgi:hypothetical protein